MVALLAIAFAAVVYAPLITLMFLRLRVENDLLHAEGDRLRVENGQLRAENVALEAGLERKALATLARGEVPAVPPIRSPAERLAYWFALSRSARGLRSGDA